MVSMLALGGGGGHGMAVVPIFVEQMDPFWSYVGMFANGSTGSALALGHFSVLVRRREGSGGSP